MSISRFNRRPSMIYLRLSFSKRIRFSSIFTESARALPTLRPYCSPLSSRYIFDERALEPISSDLCGHVPPVSSMLMSLCFVWIRCGKVRACLSTSLQCNESGDPLHHVLIENLQSWEWMLQWRKSLLLDFNLMRNVEHCHFPGTLN